ncbi:nucleotide-binding universal stress UspA family protein [Alkalibacillus filiformis]|uniref:Nucleotide-binding universal stress UspA family protein n=1 Tax=Alkalibacillus filiformis TaxID=200990 RepID=A0ABU0DPR9_9BACI|nr:universal stress protein [Alkalibacillus filiformis]MDQ0350200.1 nucleotide-binding universal stress UspA family protein [Alkalibacillus filiformis]
MYKRILLATDGSDHSLRSTEHAIHLAKCSEGTIDVVFVIDGDTSKKDVLRHANKIEIEKRRREKIQPVEERLEQSDVPHEVHMLHGEPGPSIVKFANEGEYDCTIIGSRGLNQLQTLVLGSVSHKVAKRVESPVMIVK